MKLSDLKPQEQTALKMFAGLNHIKTSYHIGVIITEKHYHFTCNGIVDKGGYWLKKLLLKGLVQREKKAGHWSITENGYNLINQVY